MLSLVVPALLALACSTEPAAPATPAAPAAAPAEAPAAAPALPAGHPPIGGTAATAEPVEKAQGEGAVTVAEAWAGKDTLSGQAVRVRGRVTKFNANIMGRNWVHLQDGSGAAADGTNDLLITTAETVAVGDVVTFQGTLATDQDFGSGYSYAVLVQDGTVAP